MADQGTAPAGAPTDAGTPANGGAPEQGQGQPADGDALYQEYVADTPEELRPFLVDVLRKQDAKITPKLQEAAAFRQRMEPYTQVEGFDELTPDDVGEFIAFRNEVLSDPSALGAWMGWMIQENPEVAPMIPEEVWASMGEQNGWLEADDGEGGFDPSVNGDGPPAWFQQYQEEQEQRLAPVLETIQQQQVDQQRSEIQGRFQARLSELEAQHGELDEQGHAHVVRLAHGYLDQPDPIGAAFEEHLRVTGQAEGQATDRKLSDAGTGQTLRGSVPDTAPPDYAHNDPELKKAALARFRG